MNPIGKKITAVHYFHLNTTLNQFFYEHHHCFDLGLNIEFESGEHLQIGWNETDQMQLRFSEYTHWKAYDSVLQKEATTEWKDCIGSKINSFETTMVSEELDLIETCTLTFENGSFAHIVLSEDNVEWSILPETLTYREPPFVYVFINKEPPRITPVRYQRSSDHGNTEVQPVKTINLFTSRGLGFVLLLLGLAICLTLLILQQLSN